MADLLKGPVQQRLSFSSMVRFQMVSTSLDGVEATSSSKKSLAASPVKSSRVNCDGAGTSPRALNVPHHAETGEVPQESCGIGQFEEPRKLPRLWGSVLTDPTPAKDLIQGMDHAMQGAPNF